jgi:hypothetical protein
MPVQKEEFRKLDSDHLSATFWTFGVTLDGMMKRLSTSPVCTILDTCLSSFNLSTKAEKKEEKNQIKGWNKILAH